jgi:hypothetical protein
MGAGSVSSVSGGGPEGVGWFRYEVASDAWSWSDEVFLVYGFAPGSVVLTTDLLLSNVHPEDRDRTEQVLVEAMAAPGSFSCLHRLLDAHRRTRKVLLAGHTEPDDDQRLVLAGQVVDVTESNRLDAKEQVDGAVAGVLEGRAVIEQAKGVLMLACGLTEDEAFRMLVTHSQATNVKIRVVAQRLMSALAEQPFVPTMPLQQQVVALLDRPRASTGEQPEVG